MPHWRNNAGEFAKLLDAAARQLRASRVRSQCAVRLPARGKLLVTGDVHDSVLHFEAAVRAARLDASPDHHIVLQEIIHGETLQDGVDMSHRLLARVAELVLAYPGQVHPILANHEIAQARGHEIEKGGVHCTSAFEAGLDEAFGDDAYEAAAAVTRFVAAMPLAVVCANGAVISHSLPSAGAMRHFDLRVLERNLIDEDLDPPFGAAHLMTWGRTHERAQLEALAREWGARVFIIGHEPAPDGVLVREPNVVILNTGHAYGRVIVLDLDKPAPTAHALEESALPIASFLEGPARGAGEALA